MSKLPTVAQQMLEADGVIVELSSPQWFDWVNKHVSFRYEPTSTTTGFTARAEKSGYWYGYRKVAGKLHKRYIGKAEELTVERLEEIAQLLESPAQPRPEKVTQEISATAYVTNTYATKEDIGQLWDALAVIRFELAAMGKLESPVVDNSPTGQQGQQNNDPSTVAYEEEINRLQNQVTEFESQVTELQKRVKIQEEQLKLADELNQEHLDLKNEHWLTSATLRNTTNELQHTEEENKKLRQKNEKLQKQLSNSLQPDYEALRDGILNRLKVGRQSSGGKAIDAFIKELQKLSAYNATQ